MFVVSALGRKKRPCLVPHFSKFSRYDPPWSSFLFHCNLSFHNEAIVLQQSSSKCAIFWGGGEFCLAERDRIKNG